jgi:hypothetical protein
MNKPITPALVLQEYDIQGRKIPMKLINEMRERFEELELEGVHPWRMLINEVMLEDEIKELEDRKERKIARDRVWVAQACAEVMLEKISQRKKDNLTTKDRTSFLEDRNQYKKFATLIESNLEDRIIKPDWFYQHILSKFNDRANFLEFMQYTPRYIQWSNTIANFSTKEEYITLFQKLDIKDWQNSNAYPQSYIRLAIAIRKQFDSWDHFLVFMNIKQDIAISKRVKSARSPEDFKKLAANLNITLSSENAISFERSNVKAFYSSIRRDNRWTGFKEFIAWMDGYIPVEGFTSSEQAQECLKQEILRLRKSDKWIQAKSSNPVSQLELETILSKQWISKNPVARAVVDYLNSPNEDE